MPVWRSSVSEARRREAMAAYVMGEQKRPLPVIVAVRDLLTLFEHVIFGLIVGNRGRHRGLLAILGVVVRVLVVGVLILGVAVGTGCHGCESCLPVSGMQTGDHASVWLAGTESRCERR